MTRIHRIYSLCISFDNFGSTQSDTESPEVLLETHAITLSTLKPSKDNTQRLGNGTLWVKLAPGERLVILGQCEVSIQKGQITLLGTTLQTSKSKYRISAPSSHSLPVIRCLATDLNAAELTFHQCETGLEHLRSLSPFFGRLWNDGSGPLGRNIIPKGAYLQPIISAPEWNEALSRFSAPSEVSRSILVCGPKSSGKSTFTKLLSNRLLSTTTERISTKGRASPGVAILDLDPGQAEYSVPGQLSLVHIKKPNFGPPFSHPVPGGTDRIVRAHSLAAITPAMDPSLYMACALDLFAHYRNLLSTVPSCPLIINTPGWVFGTGLEILVDLITKLRPTEVVYMSQEGPSEVVESLRDAAKATPVITLPSQVSKYVTKTAAHLRAMQSMSYFHVISDKENLAWNVQPLSSMPPWEIRYCGDSAGILGIMCYGEQPPSDLLLESINGSVLAVVVLEDMAAIPGWQEQEREVSNDDQMLHSDQPYTLDTEDTELRVFDDGSLHPQRVETPLIVRTPEDIPYFNPANAISLDPRHSRCIGLALVRGIDITRRRLQIITPISVNSIAEINDSAKSIVLVSGKFDTPGWAYTEEMMQKRSLKKAGNAQTEDSLDAEEGGEESDADDNGQEGKPPGESFQNAPWVERQESSQGRAVGSRVWRVRRDLGRSGE
ncbi:Polynucleotide 5 -hydroxyl-kinase GRC3 [Hyphodiscus hymeniophilus]|uniref:Polynucleotide 5'-hydroxyl-kinase GRC3 n=1 Tax=Hyphodiscus hymeniophilus TaxID=353542 RepID=A0A9P6VG40_9HELO|nr:Polynucleotide 5 -hydroxyl-kinase GRC3 [Hyphodiscus hymeniophilus]